MTTKTEKPKSFATKTEKPQNRKSQCPPPKLTNQVNNQSKIIYGRDTTNFDSEDDYRTGCRNVSHCQQLNPVQVGYL